MQLNKIKGCGEKTIELLDKLGINNTDDLIRYYPYRYNVYNPINISSANENENIVITGVITSTAKVSYIRRNFNRLSFTLETNNLICNVVIFNRAFIARNINIGKEITLIGKYDIRKNVFTANDIKFKKIISPEVEPIYHVMKGIKQSMIQKFIFNCLKSDITINEIVPRDLSIKYELMETIDAIKEIHQPTNIELLKKAKIKLKYEELFEFMFKINLIKYKNQIMDDFVVKTISDKTKEEIINKLPFALTKDQLSAVNDIVEDYNNLKRMNRLILGDVGSGKTVVSFIAIILNFMCGYQSALLSPTEVLASQHFNNFMEYANIYGINVQLLVGSQTKKEKETIINQLKNGKIDLIIGTHALLEENVEFSNIGLVVTDEQHRFGVNQRKVLQNKGVFVDILYMSATPIPRTYALTIYGDMDISQIKEKPAGRKDIETTVIKSKENSKIVSSIETELFNGHQVYVVAPLIEENEESNLNDIKKIEKMITTKINDNVGILHGKMKSSEKNKIMKDFKEGKIKVLISTTVIEVGVDVKNATLMIIFNAERFGLATLHQLRGRVGRSNYNSKCLLVSDYDTPRLKVLEESNDGFYISEKDFELRGSGDLFGIRQSGDMSFKIAEIQKDYKILLQCKKDSEEFIIKNIENNFRNYQYYQEILKELMNND